MWPSDTDIHMLPKPQWIVRPKKRGRNEEDKVGLEAEKKRTKLDHPPPTSVSPSTKVEEVQEKGAVQDHPPWRVNRVYLCEYMEEGEEVKRKPKEFPLHWQRNQLKWAAVYREMLSPQPS